MKTFAIFLLSKETFTIRTCSILESFFRKLLSKATFERKLASVSLALDYFTRTSPLLPGIFRSHEAGSVKTSCKQLPDGICCKPTCILSHSGGRTLLGTVIRLRDLTDWLPCVTQELSDPRT